MISNCPHCNQELRFSDAQLARIEKALSDLQPGKILKLACPECRGSIELNSDASTSGSVMEDILYSGGQEKPAPGPPREPPKPPPHAPQPPDLSWLSKGDFQTDREWTEDVPTVLILAPEGKGRQSMAGAYEARGYQVVVAESGTDALEKMRFGNFSAVIYHPAIDEVGLPASDFHRHMREMAMDRRRQIHYTLIGPDLRTLYDLEALALSANLVVNEADLQHLPLVLKKALHDYEELFAPIITALREYGKR